MKVKVNSFMDELKYNSRHMNYQPRSGSMIIEANLCLEF